MNSTQIILLLVCAATYVQAAGTVDEKAKITLACLLGGIPAVSIIMFTVFCVWIKRRKRRAQKDALANGIEIGPDGWPLKPTHRVSLPENRSIAGTVSDPPPEYAGSVQGRRSDAKAGVV
ncbi:kinase domain protein [Ceratobasidium sp. AG-Ba]|nr:kinase domain protein [Ceratobasidium sp. AG-Ba]